MFFGRNLRGRRTATEQADEGRQQKHENRDVYEFRFHATERQPSPSGRQSGF